MRAFVGTRSGFRFRFRFRSATHFSSYGVRLNFLDEELITIAIGERVGELVIQREIKSN